MKQAFVLGAGLGSRLKKLTEFLPKPLISVAHQPLISRVFDHLLSVGINDFVVNTHHCAEAYEEAFPEGRYLGKNISFRHEPILLETAGGIANIADLLNGEDFLVYNGDVLCDLPLEPLIRATGDSGNLVTLGLRSTGVARHIAWDAGTGRITDIRNKLETGDLGSYQFTGIYAVSPGFLSMLTPGKKESVIPRFLELIQQSNGLGGVLLDEGRWHDLGDRESYLQAHEEWFADCPDRLHPLAKIAPDADIDEKSFVGPNAVVETGAVLRDTVVWPGAIVGKQAQLDRCIVRTGCTAAGVLSGEDI